jgi:hypothetical protein
MRKFGVWVACAAAGVWALPAAAQYGSDYEALNASSAGIDLNGQDDYYNPDPVTSVSAKVYTYAANALGLPQNPTGGAKFVGGNGPAGGFFSRSQRNVTYGDGTGSWTNAFDFAGTFTGTGASANNVGSFSAQLYGTGNPPPEATYIHLAQWVDVNNPVAWNSTYLPFDASGVAFPQPGASPGAAWAGLEDDHWYRSSTTFDLDTNLITEVCIEDLEDGGSPHNGCFNPAGWYLGGGAAGGLPPPSGFRYFAGSSTVAGNTLAFDNIDITPEPASALLLAVGGFACLRRKGS